jgi:thioredoxin reductase (NADPH)
MEQQKHSLGQAQEREAEADVQGVNDRRNPPPASSRAMARMPKPMLVVVDSGSVSFRRIEYELKKRYDNDYQVVSIPSSKWGIKRLQEFKAAEHEVALVLADQWMPDMSGTEFVAQARQLFPTAKRALLIAWGDRTAQEPILRSMTLGHVDYYVNKPEQPGDEHFHRLISEFLYEWAKTHRPPFHEMRMVGERQSARSHELRDILNRNGVLHEFYAADSEPGRELLAQVGKSSAKLPVLIIYNGKVLEDPSNVELADAFGVNRPLDRQEFDLVIVGAGPAGLASAVYGASEGLSTLVLEGEAIGGQAGTSSLIRNYLGFPWGVGGAELASRATEQAIWFGTTFRFMRQATALSRRGKELMVSLSDGTEVGARAVILATGASYRRLGVPSLEALVGAGVFYGAAVSEARAVEGQEVYVVGGANSAGQAAIHLSKYASRVTLVARGSKLTASMSEYLIKEIEAANNIDVRFDSRVVDGGGKGRLEHLVLKNTASGLTETVPAAALFVLIGAEPRTEWLPEEIERDKSGFIVTGQDLLRDTRKDIWNLILEDTREGDRPPQRWPLERHPLLLETSMPGVFAAGDVRHRSVKRVASAVGEGSIAIQLIHEYFIKDRLGFDNLDPIPDKRAEDDTTADEAASGNAQRSASAT